jgi:hypothetical protein
MYFLALISEKVFVSSCANHKQGRKNRTRSYCCALAKNVPERQGRGQFTGLYLLISGQKG